MTENKDLHERRPAYIQKADMAVSELTSGGGALVPEQRDRFILVNIKGSVVTEKINVVKMTRETLEIPRMTTMGTRVWFPATESQALPIGRRTKPGFGKATMTSVEVMAQVDYPRYVLQAQIEGPQFHDTLVAYLGLHTRRDWEDLIFNGYTSSTDPWLALFNGMWRGASSNTYTAGVVALSSSVLKALQLTMPSEYRNQPNLIFLTNDVAWSAYDDELMARGTPLGDVHQAGMTYPALPFKGKQVVYVPLAPNTLGGGSETVVLYANPKGFTLGVHQDIEVQTEYDIRTRVWTVVVTARLAQTYEYEPGAVAKATQVLGA